MTNRTIARSLRDARKAKGLTQEEAAAAVGITRVHYNRIEGGRVTPKRSTMDAILELLGCRMVVTIENKGA